MSTEPDYTEEPETSSESIEDRVRALEAELAEERAERQRLEDKIETIQDANRAYWNHFLDRLFPGIDVTDYQSDPMPRFSPVADFAQDLHQTIDTVNENPGNPTGDPMTENWQAVIEHAQSLANDPHHQRPDGQVALYVQDVANATGKSKRWCRTLVEELAEDHVGATLQEAKDNPKQGSENRKKALLVHMDVWGDEQ